MMQASIYGRLAADPKTRQTRNDKTMAMVNIAVDATPNNAEDSETLWLSVLAFGRQADELARHSKGDLVSLSGRVTKSRWVAQNGTEREQLSIIADTVISARTTRPKGGKKKPIASNHHAASMNFQSPEVSELNDGIPF